MALQTFKGGLWMPTPVITNDVSPLLSLTLDAANENAGFVVRAPKTGTIDRVIYSLITVSVTSGPLNFDARLETVSATTGLNTGTLLAAGANGTDSIADTDDNDQREITLGTPVAVTIGDLICFNLVAPGSGTFNVQLSTLGGDVVVDEPYAVANGAKSNRGPVLGFRYDDASYHAPLGSIPCETVTQSAIGSASTPDEVGNRFTFPFPCRTNGLYLYVDPTAGTDFTVNIYDSGGSALFTKTLDTDQNYDATDGGIFLPTPDLDWDANELFRVTMSPNTTSQDFLYFTVESASYMDMFDGGQSIHGTERTNAGAWTDTTTKRYMISVRICAFDDAVGGGGGGLASNVFGPGVIR